MPDPVSLKRQLGLWEVTLTGVGIILGAGIYVLIGKAAAVAGNAIWLSFALAALIAVFTGLSYAELSAMFPYAGAEYEYTAHAFNRRLAFVVGILVILSGVVGASTVALGFSGYFQDLTGLPPLPTAAALIILVSLLIARGIGESTRIAILFTLVETAGLLGIIAIGLPHLGSVDYLEMPSGLPGVFSAAALVFFAYQGFESIAKLAEETKVPERNIPRGLLYAIAISTILYLLVAVAAVSAIGWEHLAASPAPFAEIAAHLGAESSVVFALIALAATANTVLIMLLTSSRITYSMARDGSLPLRLGRVHRSRQTPMAAIAGLGIVALLFILPADIALVAEITNFSLFIAFLVINAAVIVLRYRSPDLPRPFRVPLNPRGIPLLPLGGLLVSAFFLLLLSPQSLLVGTFLLLLTWATSYLPRKR
ncbi:MAG: amino acid permease [Methanomicrobiales archaeon]|nr:amino acid permease [Methanomicrobiales archaeon]